MNIQRKPAGAKIAQGQTNFMERNRERLAQIQARSKERQNPQNSKERRVGSYERRMAYGAGGVGGPRSGSNNARNASNDSRNARQPLYQRNAANPR